MTSTSTTAGSDADLVAEDLDLDAPNPSAIYDVVDEDEMLYGASNTFPIKPDELVAKCKSALRAGFANIGDELAARADRGAFFSHWFPYDRVGVVNADP